jgi:hypothetical protein
MRIHPWFFIRTFFSFGSILLALYAAYVRVPCAAGNEQPHEISKLIPSFANMHLFRSTLESREDYDFEDQIDTSEAAADDEIEALIAQPFVPSIDSVDVIEPALPTFINLSESSTPSTIPLAQMVAVRPMLLNQRCPLTQLFP